MERRAREEGSKEGDREEGEVREKVEERGRGTMRELQASCSCSSPSSHLILNCTRDPEPELPT